MLLTDMLTIRLILSRTEAGRLIGIQGQNIKDIRSYTQADISIDKDRNRQRTVNIKGKSFDVFLAIDEIINSIQGQSSVLWKRPLRL